MNLCRTCIVCKNKKKKNDLIRVVSDNSDPIYDKLQKINSRGIYFCRDVNCLNKAIMLLDKNKLNLKIVVNKIKLRELIINVEKELGD